MKRLSSSILFLVFTLLPIAGAEAQDFGGVPIDPIGVQLREIFLGRPGEALICPGCPEGSPFRVDTATGIRRPATLPYWRVNSLVSSSDGKKLLVSTTIEDGKQSLLLILSAESLSPISRIEIPGNGLGMAISEDGYSAYVIVHQPRKKSADLEGRWELAEVDLGKGVVTQRYPLASPAWDLALAPDGTRLYLAQEGKIQTFRTHPFTASWFYRSPGHNRGMAIHPARPHLYVLRGSSIAIFDEAERKPLGDGEDVGGDDAARVFPIPIRLEQLVFAKSGLVAVGAGLDLDEMVVIDSRSQRLAGVWPHDAGEVGELLRQSAAAEIPNGPRGKLVVTDTGLVPPFSLPPPPAPPENLRPPSTPARRDEKAAVGPPDAKSESAPTDSSTPASSTSIAPAVSGAPPAPAQGERTSAPPASPPDTEISPDHITLVEVADQVLEGTLTGEISLVREILLYGPDSIFQILARTTPDPNGHYSFKLPNPGRYRIVPDGGAKVTLVRQPAFRTVEVKSFGFKKLDFHIKGAAFGSAVPPEKIVR